MYIDRSLKAAAATAPRAGEKDSPEDFMRAALRNASVPAIQKALRDGASIDWRNPESNGETLLMRAARRGDLLVVKYLLERGADASLEDYSGRYPLHVAALEGHVLVLQILIQKKAAVIDEEDAQGDTALHLACLNGSLPAVRLLISSNADPEQRNCTGATPFDLAAKALHHHVVEYFEVAQVDEEGRSLQDLDKACNVQRAKQLQTLQLAARPKKKPKPVEGKKKK